MDLRKAIRRGVPLVLIGAAATVALRKRLQPLPALPPGDPSIAADPPAEDPSAAIAEHSAAIVATAALTERGVAAPAPHELAGAQTNGVHDDAPAATTSEFERRFTRRLRRAPIDIVTVVDDLLGAVR